jgi:hypothetical protein
MSVLPGSRRDGRSHRRSQGTWGRILAAHARPGGLGVDDVDLLEAVAHQIAAAVETDGLMQRLERQLELAEALRRVSADISSKLDLQVILAETVDQAMTLFGADRAAVFRLGAEGVAEAPVSKGLSERFLQHAVAMPSPSLPRLAMETGEALFATGYADDPRGRGLRDAVIEEGFDTVAVAPLVAEGRSLGVLVLYHDRHRPWSTEPDALRPLPRRPASHPECRHLRSDGARAAQLQSIQQLGTRLDRMSSVREIGMAIAVELQQLIDYHNVRVYRVVGDDCLPVAWRGNIGEYTDEVEDELRLKVGQGITGWVAAHGVAQYMPDANADERAQTIAGTQTIDESMLIAPMISSSVMGVIVLPSSGSTSSRVMTCGLLGSTPLSPPRRWPMPTPPSSRRPVGDARAPAAQPTGAAAHDRSIFPPRSTRTSSWTGWPAAGRLGPGRQHRHRQARSHRR